MDEVWQQIAAVVGGALVVVIYRLIDRYLPDPEDRHPLPPGPGTAPKKHRKN